MTIEEKMDHFRRMSLESANSQSSESLSSYKQSLDEELEIHKESATQLAEESKRALFNQVRASSKKELASAQMMIRKNLTHKQSLVKSQVFDIVREKIAAYRKTPEYVLHLIKQIEMVMSDYSNLDITIYIDPDTIMVKYPELKEGDAISVYQENEESELSRTEPFVYNIDEIKPSNEKKTKKSRKSH